VRTRLGVKWKARRQEREKEEWRRPLTFVQSCVVGRKAEDSQNPGCQPRAMATVGKEKPRTSRARIRVAGLMRQPGWGRVRLAGSREVLAEKKKREEKRMARPIVGEVQPVALCCGLMALVGPFRRCGGRDGFRTASGLFKISG